ncbi:MAG TPA: LTA synthase family protein [Thermoanaerobaculia bacterium]|nr:LTA synthase family protein [Thermoanaerobaculia bacterium]
MSNVLEQTRALLLRSRYRLAVALLAFYMAVWLITRLALLAFQQGASRDGLLPVLKALGAGLVLDGASALWLCLPLVLYLAVIPERWYRRRLQKLVLGLGLSLAVFSALFVAAAEYYFFDEFNSRFNFVAVDYLVYPTEVAGNIWQSYHAGIVLTVLGLASVVMIGILWRLARSSWDRVTPPVERLAFVAGFGLLLAGATATVSPALAHVSEDRALNEVAENGYYSFWRALLGTDAPYEGLYATRPQPAVLARLHRLLGDEPSVVPGSFAPDSTLRRIRNPGPPKPINVVVVLEESLGADFIGALHPPKAGEVSLTPRYDALAKEGTLLTRAYSTGNRTIRAIEATTSSLPPLPGESIARREASVHLFTLPELLKSQGYQTMFVYGGRALFDGMGRYLSRNGVERIVDQGDFPPGTFTTAWGACDEAIFAKALAEMEAARAQGKPFYSLVLSVSNHRPFAFPEDHLKYDRRYHRRENAVRYADYALGGFMARARAKGFYRDTLFVLMGDHGARVYGAAEIPLASYEVPILFLGAGVPEGRRVDTLASSLDVPPTVMGLLGMSYDSKFFGHDVLRVPPSEGRALLTHNSEIALMREGRMAVLGLHESLDLYDVDLASGDMKRRKSLDRADRDLAEDAIAYYNGADRLYRGGAYAYGPARPSPEAWASILRGERLQ